MSDVSHVVDSDAMPSWKEAAGEKDSHDGNLLVEWEFAQDVLLDSNYQIVHNKKETHYDLTKESKDVRNQTGLTHVYVVDRNQKMWEILLDNQSTCKVIINIDLLTIIRRCDWKLRLQTQSGE